MAPPSIRSNEDEQTPRKRQRARRACLPCRQRKRKCDVQIPCSMCKTYGYRCQYGPDDGPAADYADDNPNGLDIQAISTSVPSPKPKRARIIPRQRTKSESPHSDTENGPSDPVKKRFIGTYSIMAFPRTLGLDFQSSNPPRVHSFAWNCGVRPTEPSSTHVNIDELVSRFEADTLIEKYFQTVHPVFGILEPDHFHASVQIFRESTPASPPSLFSAILAGVLALGSYFSKSPGHPQEATLAAHAKDILDDPNFPVSIDHVAAWNLRTLYLRSITGPHQAWISSSMAMHLAEAVGLHQEVDPLDPPPVDDATPPHCRTCEHPRRVFWGAWMSNAMVSYEYGRSPVNLPNITCHLPVPVPGSAFTGLIDLVRLVPRSNQDPDLAATLSTLSKLPNTHPFVALSKADLCMSVYRHSRLLRQHFPKSTITSFMAVGSAAISAAARLARDKIYWWNVLCTVFQYVCVLLALDTMESLAGVKEAMGRLEEICTGLESEVAREAVGMARVLIRDSRGKKRREVEMLEGADGVGGAAGGGGSSEQPVERNTLIPAQNQLPVSNEPTIPPTNYYDFDPSFRDMDWDALLDPWYMSTFATQEFGSGLGMGGIGNPFLGGNGPPPVAGAEQMTGTGNRNGH